tara:strand:+ start:79010 stop:81358 length:2349 start_codon:yes stop_codon:yes gene_type:complete
MYVRFEWSYDNFHTDKNSIYRLTEQTVNSRNNQIRHSTIHSYPQSIALEEEFPEIKTLINISGGSAQFLKDGKYILEPIKFADPEFLSEFTFPLIFGDSKTALSNLDNIVITESAAKKYFGKTNAVGELMTIRLRDKPKDFMVSGIAKDVPANSSILFNFLLPFENQISSASAKEQKTLRESWYIGFLETWITLKEDATKEELEAKFPAFLERHYGSSWVERDQIKYELQPLSEVYFNEDYRSAITQSSNKTYSLILGSIALVILLIAGINFMSLTLSRNTSRHHEIGIRKTVGAVRHQIKFQIIGEVFITCSFAIILGIVLAELLAPYSGVLFQKELDLSLLSDPVLWISVLGLLIILTLITSLYPALKISGKNATSLFSDDRTAQKIPMLIKGLIVVQFGLAITLMIGTYVMQGQINFILNKDLGFNPENVVAVEINSELQNALKIGQLYSEEAQRIPGILSTSVTAGEYRDYSEYGVVDIGMAQMRSATTLSQLGDGIPSEAVDAQYLETMDIELLTGVNFSKQANTSPSDEIIVNQAFVDAMGWDNPIGQVLEDKPENQGWVGPFDGKKVIGVIENYHFKSLYDPLKPMALQHIETVERNPGTILIRLSSDRMPETISNLKSLWNSIAGQEAFNLSFMDDMVQHQYNEEIRWNRIIRISSMTSILLACFGLFGLSALVAQRRIKEIGIRKVFGASIKNILVLISKDFVLLVVCGFAISAPVAWYLSNQWLTGFSYKIDLGVLPFLYGGLTVLLIALTTVSWQSVKAALQNPVENLRNE